MFKSKNVKIRKCSYLKLFNFEIVQILKYSNYLNSDLLKFEKS
jgi:hypothetical protein